MSRINISPKDCKFIVNKEKRKIVCILENTDELLEDFIDGYTLDTLLFSRCKEVFLPNRFIGIATCSPEDEWDEEFGKRVAYTRMKNSFYKMFFNKANIYIDRVDKEINGLIELLNSLGDRVSANLSKDKQYIENHFKHE